MVEFYGKLVGTYTKYMDAMGEEFIGAKLDVFASKKGCEKPLFRCQDLNLCCCWLVFGCVVALVAPNVTWERLKSL